MKCTEPMYRQRKATEPIDSKFTETSTRVVSGLFMGSTAVKQQVCFQLVLLDRKCYPNIESHTTTGSDCWKSSHKVLAASKCLHEALLLHDLKRAHDDDSDGQSTPSSKAKCCCPSM